MQLWHHTMLCSVTACTGCFIIGEYDDTKIFRRCCYRGLSNAKRSGVGFNILYMFVYGVYVNIAISAANLNLLILNEV